MDGPLSTPGFATAQQTSLPTVPMEHCERSFCRPWGRPRVKVVWGQMGRSDLRNWSIFSNPYIKKKQKTGPQTWATNPWVAAGSGLLPEQPVTLSPTGSPNDVLPEMACALLKIECASRVRQFWGMLCLAEKHFDSDIDA